jgi:hypothetical protein
MINPSTSGSFTFGQLTTDGNTVNYRNANEKTASIFTCPSNGTLSSITADIFAYAGTPTNSMASLYAINSDGSLGALLATTQSLVLPTYLNTVTWTFASPPTVVSGTQYGLSVVCDQSYQVYGVPGTSYYNSNTYSSGFSDPFGASTAYGVTLTIYANGTATPITPTQTYIVNYGVTPTKGSLPFTITFSGYLSRNSNTPDTGTIVNGENIQLQLIAPGGTAWANTGITVTTAPGPSGNGYFTGTWQLAEPTIYPGPWQFKAYYAGSTTKNMFGCDNMHKRRDLRKVNALIL